MVGSWYVTSGVEEIDLHKIVGTIIMLQAHKFCCNFFILGPVNFKLRLLVVNFLKILSLCLFSGNWEPPLYVNGMKLYVIARNFF